MRTLHMAARFTNLKAANTARTITANEDDSWD